MVCSCVGVCMCAGTCCMCVCAGTHVYVDAHYGHDMDARGQPQVGPQESSILVFRDKSLSLGPGAHQGLVGTRLVGKSQESVYLCLLNARMTITCNHPHLCWTKLRPPCLCSKDFTS